MHAFDDLRSDVAFGLRTAAKTPLVTAVLIATLALGIAATKPGSWRSSPAPPVPRSHGRRRG